MTYRGLDIGLSSNSDDCPGIGFVKVTPPGSQLRVLSILRCLQDGARGKLASQRIELKSIGHVAHDSLTK
jgi:hypothetical protein